MSILLSLSWRFLLAVALVFNPVLGAASALAAGDGEADEVVVASASETVPPCHGTSHDAAPQEHDSGASEQDHGCDCGNPACQFGVCCAVGALDLVAPLFAPSIHAGAQALASRDFQQADAPPPARMIRPPIA